MKILELRGSAVEVLILDTAGQEEFLPLRNNWIGERDAFIVAMDITNPSVEVADKFNEWINTYHVSPRDTAVSLVFTKCDLPYDSHEVEKVVKFAKEHHW